MNQLDRTTIESLAIAVPIWVATTIAGAAYINAANRVVLYLKEFHGPAWDRLQRRFLVFRRAGRNRYFAQRKARALRDVVWCWRAPRRHQELDRMVRSVRRLAVVAVAGMVASIVVFALFDRTISN